MALTERPYKTSFSKNDIRYVFQLADLTRTGLYLQVRVNYKALADDTFTENFTFDLKPNSDGYVYVYLQNYLDSLLQYAFPRLNGTIVTTADEQAQNFYLDWREITDDNPDPDWVTAESDNVRTVIKGGIEKNKFSRNNIFVNYLETQKPFLTWNPSGHFAFENEIVFLSFINPMVSNNNLLVNFSVTDINGNVVSNSAQTSANGFLYHLNVSPTVLFQYVTITAKAVYYQVNVTDKNSGTILVNNYRIYIEQRPLYKKYYDLVYFNSLGGLSAVRVLGETAVTVNRDYDETDGGIKLNWQDTVNTFETSHTNTRLQRDFKGDIGYLRNRSKKQQEAFIELLADGPKYQLIDNRWIPVTNLQKSADLGKNTDTLQSFPVEWSLSETNEVFTPEDALFGAGSDTEDYTVLLPPPTGLVIININDVADGTATFAELTETGRTPGSAWVQQLKIGGTPVNGDVFGVSVYGNNITSTYTGSIASTIADIASKINALNIAAQFNPPTTITAAVDGSDNTILDITFDYNHSASCEVEQYSTHAEVSFSYTAPTPAPDSYTMIVTNNDDNTSTTVTNFTGSVTVLRGHTYRFALRAEYSGGSSAFTPDVVQYIG